MDTVPRLTKLPETKEVTTTPLLVADMPVTQESWIIVLARVRIYDELICKMVQWTKMKRTVIARLLCRWFYCQLMGRPAATDDTFFRLSSASVICAASAKLQLCLALRFATLAAQYQLHTVRLLQSSKEEEKKVQIVYADQAPHVSLFLRKPSVVASEFGHCLISKDKFVHLWERYRHTQHHPDRNQKTPILFLARVWAMLQRYGLATEDAGLQGALPDAVMEILQKEFGVTCECSAAPTNVHVLNDYCSPHPDTDCFFGSLGNFLEFKPTHGSFECNPPFGRNEPFMIGMVQHALALCIQAEKAKAIMSFVFILPAALDQDPCRMVLTSDLCRGHLILDYNNHVYKHGHQHLFPSTKFVADFRTVMIWLQTTAASKKWPVTPTKLEQIVSAFSPHPK